MTLLTHQIIVSPDHADQFAHECEITPFKWRVGFSWYLFPVVVAGKQEWLLVNVEFGYCAINTLRENNTAMSIGVSALLAIEYHMPEDREEYNVSVSRGCDCVTWHTAEKMPAHVGDRYLRARKRLKKCKTIGQAEDELEKLNEIPLTLGGRTFAPTRGVEGLLRDLADAFRDYIETTPWWKVRWHLWTNRSPWLELGYRSKRDA
ncbi:hypothetical protein [Ectothiorhodospira variabilis]|uniref:hypothetical protein n=1 Tax=Ectothiorhodospira variabilis TaxID=505694 RepID=UPI001EFB8794|nr:hypothetical protein [Ectothiorhodospira variabilis]MCG5496585.1 hypothetical protein [Ectothiorhodospira variabilis]